MFKRINWIEARTAFRKRLNVYYFHNDEYHILPSYNYSDRKDDVSRHSFLFSSQKIKENLNLKKLNYFIKN